jgi:O-acetyl-ADP-ribose deacetylase (regulator of RNase III)
MAINIISGNIFTTKCQTLVNTINCVGVMGAGLALECRLRYPDMHQKYIELCLEKQIDIGLLWIYKSEDRWILNFPTKKDWKYPSKKEYLRAGLAKFVSSYETRGVESIAFPLLGADKGGLHHEESLEIMLEYLENVPIDIEIYRYDKMAKDDLYDKTKGWLLSQDLEHVASLSKIRKNYILKVIEAMHAPTIVQLNQLALVDGIGIKTLEKIFILAQNSALPESGAFQARLI